MMMEDTECNFLTLRQCPRSHIFTLIPVDPFEADTIRDINKWIDVATVACAGRDSAYVMGVVFNDQ